MKEKIKEIYKSALKDEKFLFYIYEADKDKKPNMFASELEKHIFATMYYGWLVAKYGKDWKSNLK